MKLTEMRIVSLLFAALVSLSAAGGWHLYSTLRTVEKELPVEWISQRPEQSAVITSLSRVKTALEVVMAEPMEDRLLEFTLALHIANATIQTYYAANPSEIPDDIRALYDEIDWLMSSFEDLVSGAPPVDSIRAQALDVRLDYVIAQLRNIDAETTREALRILVRQVSQIERLRVGTIIVLALITFSLGVMCLMLIWQRHTITLLEEAKRAVEDSSRALGRELEKGRKIQQDFLPKEIPKLNNLDIAATFIPALQVSGDFYDAFKLTEDHVGLCIGDISDKGVGSALFMALIRSLIRVFATQCCSIEEAYIYGDTSLIEEKKHANILRTVDLTNLYISEEHGDEGMFATLFFGVLNHKSGRLIYVNAGHEPVFLISSFGAIEKLSATGPAIGLISETKYKSHQLRLTHGNIMFGFTDGVTDARSPSDELYTRNRLEQSIEKIQFSSSKKFLKDIESGLFKFIDNAPQSDDITMLAVRWE